MTEDHDDFAFEPIPGLPEKLPEGETLLWQGSPDWRALAASAFHVRKVAAYFGIVAIWSLATAGVDATPASMLASVLTLALFAGAAAAILTGLAYLYARGTIYTLTTKRVVIRSGLALPVTLNLPLSQIDTAAVSMPKGRAGSVALTVVKPNRIAYLALWPNVKPLAISNPQPTLRCLPDAETLAKLLARTLAAEAGMTPHRTQAAAPSPSRDGVHAGRTVAA